MTSLTLRRTLRRAAHVGFDPYNSHAVQSRYADFKAAIREKYHAS